MASRDLWQEALHALEVDPMQAVRDRVERNEPIVQVADVLTIDGLRVLASAVEQLIYLQGAARETRDLARELVFRTITTVLQNTIVDFTVAKGLVDEPVNQATFHKRGL